MEDWGSFFDQAPTTQAQLPVAAMRYASRQPGTSAFGSKGIFPTASQYARPTTLVQSQAQQPKVDLSAGLPMQPPKIAQQGNELENDVKGVSGLVDAIQGKGDAAKKPDKFHDAMATIDQQLAQMRADREQMMAGMQGAGSTGAAGSQGGAGFTGTLPAGSVNGVFGRMINQESGGNHFRNGMPITSPAGAIGIAQVMPGTAPGAAKLAGVPWDPELFNRKQTGDPQKDAEARDYNLKLGRAYYDEQLKAFGDPVLAAAAYNAGPGAVQTALAKSKATGNHYINFLPAETQNYVKVVAGNGDDDKQVASADTTPTGKPETGWASGGRVRWLRSMVGA